MPPPALLRPPLATEPVAPLSAPANVVTGRRVVAGLLDMVPLIFLAVALGDRSSESGRFDVSLQGVQVVWWLTASVLYYAIAELATATSPGKAIMGLCVRDVETAPPTKRQIIVRSAMRILDVLPVMYVVGLIVAACSSRRQRLGDKAARTLVLQRSEVEGGTLGSRAVAALAAVVVVTVAVGSILIAASASQTEKVGSYDLNPEVMNYAREIIEDGFRPVSRDVLRDYLAPGVASDDDVDGVITAMLDLVGELTDDYEIVDHHFATYTIPTTGDSVESVDLLIRAQFEKRPGQLILTIADVDGELALVGFHFNA